MHKKGVKCTRCILKDTQKVRVCEVRNYLRKLGRSGSLHNQQTFINNNKPVIMQTPGQLNQL